MAAVDIYNLALGRLRVGKAVGDPAETSTTATICRRFYDQCRQEVLRAFPWQFAQRAQALAVTTQTFPGWAYVYSYPQDCLKINAVMDELGLRLVTRSFNLCDALCQSVKRMPFQLALKDDNESGVILSDVPDAWGYFTADLETTGVFPADFTSVLAWRLAMEIGGPVQADAGMIDRAETRYSIWLSTATAQAMNESKDDTAPDSPSIACRQ